MQIDTGFKAHFVDDDNGTEHMFEYRVSNVSTDGVVKVITEGVNDFSDNARSQWVWIEMPDGTRWFACGVQGLNLLSVT